MDEIDLELGLTKLGIATPDPIEDVAPIEHISPKDIDLKYRILQRLVLQLQSRWRGRKIRAAVLPIMAKMRQDKARREKFLAILYEDELERSQPKEQQRQHIKKELPRSEEHVHTELHRSGEHSDKHLEQHVDAELSEEHVDEYHVDEYHVDEEHMNDPVELSVVTKIEDPLSMQIYSANTIKSLVMRFEYQAELIRLLANSLVQKVQENEEADSFEEGSEFEVESVDILVPVALAGSSWMIQEVTDMERYELQFERFRFAATKIQRFIRRFLTRQKFIAYINDKTLDTAWTEREQLREVDEEPHGLEQVVSNDTINTDGCPVM